MFDVSSKFNSFYNSKVVLPQKDQNELYNKMKLNIDRLKDGLKEYNLENSTSYQLVDSVVQGSVSMSTVVQIENNKYDIDVAIIFDRDCIGEIGPRALRNIVVDALKRKTQVFKVKPENKTSCVRVSYGDGYHIDFAVYRRTKTFNGDFLYEHAGDGWTKRDVQGMSKWFENENK